MPTLYLSDPAETYPFEFTGTHLTTRLFAVYQPLHHKTSLFDLSVENYLTNRNGQEGGGCRGRAYGPAGVGGNPAWPHLRR